MSALRRAGAEFLRFLRWAAVTFLIAPVVMPAFLLGMAVVLARVGFGAGLAAGRDLLGWWTREGDRPMWPTD